MIITEVRSESFGSKYHPYTTFRYRSYNGVPLNCKKGRKGRSLHTHSYKVAQFSSVPQILSFSMVNEAMRNRRCYE